MAASLLEAPADLGLTVASDIISPASLFHFGSVILTNLEDGPATDVVRVSLIVGLFFTYGFQMFPILEV